MSPTPPHGLEPPESPRIAAGGRSLMVLGAFVLALVWGLLLGATLLHAQATPPATPEAGDTITATVTAIPQATASQTETQAVGPIPVPTVLPPVTLPPVDTQVLTGTILANRTPVTVTFFLEGQLYLLPPSRATSVTLPRAVAGLSLFNCPADTSRPEKECFWDPYPVRRDGFYEIVDVGEEGSPVALVMKDAVPPPKDRVWIQNRTGHRERLLHGEDLRTVDNGSVLEILLDPEGPPEGNQVYLRHCIALGEEIVCEWLPYSLEGGVYYALVDETRPGPIPQSAITVIRLEPLLFGPGVEPPATPTPTPTPEPLGVSCRIQVPALNVRAGPGTQYRVIGQVRQDGPTQGQVTVVGRNQDNTWLAVDPELVPGGWVIHRERFLVCASETGSLPLAPVTDGRLAATPTPTPQAPDASAQTPSGEAGPGLPPETALLIVTNAFDYPVRFTLDAREHGFPEGTPSEYDLEPGQSIQFQIRAGRVRFSASTPFRGGLGGNAEFVLQEGETRELFLHFRPSEDDPDRWELRY